MQEYPRLKQVILLLADDNGLTLKPEGAWYYPGEARLFEGLLALLNRNQIETVVAGDQDEAEQILQSVGHPGLWDFHEWLNNVFDGPFHTCFFRR